MAEQPQVSPEQTRLGCLQILRTVFLVMPILTLFQFATRGAAVNHKQLVFRISTIVIGVIGLAVVQIILTRAQRQAHTAVESTEATSDTDVDRPL